MTDSIACFILAGGKSSRFGSNKSLALVGSEPMAKIVANNLRSAFGGTAQLIGADQQSSLELGLETFIGSREGNGPLAAVVDAMEHAEQLIVAVAPNDTPFFSPMNFRALLAKLEDSSIDVAVAVSGTESPQTHWLLSVWRKESCLPKLLVEYERGVRSVHGAVKDLHIALVSFDANLVRNVNAVSDLSDRGTI